MFKKTIFYLILSSIYFTSCKQKTTTFVANTLWQPGYLDIHFIHTGQGNSSFIIFPDSTTLLIDAGEAKPRNTHPYYPPFNNEKLTAGQRIVKYIEHFSPKDTLDYALITHFHSDHYGELTSQSKLSKNNVYKLTGITDVGEYIKIKSLIDRGYPNYEYPIVLKENDSTFLNYLKFIIYQKGQYGMNIESLDLDKYDQIKMIHNPKDYSNFKIENLKVNQYILSEEGNSIEEYNFNPPLVNDKGYYNENPLSTALKISYGNFDYYVGGDLPGINDYPDYDIESAISKCVGEVDAMSLNHHGHKDASNLNFLKTLTPQVIAHQAIHDPHFAPNVQENLLKINADVFTFFMSDSIKNIYKEQVKKRYKGIYGNFFIRVYPEGEEFSVFTLDPNSNDFRINNQFGFYKSRK